MDITDYVFVINSTDTFYGEKFIIRAIETDFVGRITSYTVSDFPGNGHEETALKGKYRDYLPTDLQYTTKQGRTFTQQMQLL